MSIRDEFEKIPRLRNASNALADFVEDICPRITFEKKGRRWVGSMNFVAFTIQHSRARNIKVSLRGSPKEFPEFKELPLKADMGYGAYSVCTLKQPGQLHAIALYIQRAYELYRRGGTRQRKQLEVKEKG